jgi:hypothetical protein
VINVGLFKTMTRAQRIVAVLYCLLVVYCCVWVPWVASTEGVKDISQGYSWVWSSPGAGVPSLPAILTRIMAVTALSAAAFVLAGKWKVLLAAAIVAVLTFAGILLHAHWTERASERAAERRAQKIHDCAVAKVATAKCTPSAPPPGYVRKKGEIDLSAGFEVCDSYALSDNSTAQEADKAIAAAEKECTAEIETKQKSAHEEIEEYKRQHGIKD